MEAEQFAQPLAREAWRCLCEALSPTSPASPDSDRDRVREEPSERKAIMLLNAGQQSWQQEASKTALARDELVEEVKLDDENDIDDDGKMIDRGAIQTIKSPAVKVADLDVEALQRELVPVLKEGLLHKRKQKGIRMGVWNWQHRFCCLDNTDRVFRYGPQELSSDTRSIPYAELYRAYLTIDAGDHSTLLGSCREFCLELTADAGKKNASRVFVFRAPDPIDARAWVKAFRAVSVQGREWETRGRRISHVLESRWCKQQGECASSPPEQQTTPSPAAKREQDETTPPAAAILEKVDVHEDSKMRLKTLTERIIARANERRREQQRKKAEARQALASPIASSPGPLSSTAAVQGTNSFASSKFWYSCVPSCMALCIQPSGECDVGNLSPLAKQQEMVIFPPDVGQDALCDGNVVDNTSDSGRTADSGDEV